jgi:hypothetical protein
MRRLLLLLLATTAGCGRGGEESKRAPGPSPAPSSANAQAPGDDRIVCATGGADRFERICTLDRGDSPKGQVLTLYSPDGSFRRLLVTRDGRGVVAADGAERAKVSLVGPNEIEVAVAGDRYRLPAHAR